MNKKLLLATLALTAAGAAFGVTPPPSELTTMPAVVGTLESSARSINGQLVGYAIKTLSAALILQWLFTYWKEIISGDMTSMLAKCVGIIMWGGVGYFALDNQEILINMFQGYINLSKTLTGVQFDPGLIWDNGVDLQANLAFGFYSRPGSDSFIGVVKNVIPGLVILLACLAILISYGVIALSVFVAIAEGWMMIAVAPIAIGMIGLAAFRDQGMAPLKGIISLGLRIIILSVIIKILGNVQQSALDVFTKLPEVDPSTKVWYVLGGVFACAFFALNAGKLASSIASGSASFSGSDAIRGGMQAAQTVATVATAGAAIGAAGIQAASKGGASAASAAKAFAGRGDLNMSRGATGSGTPAVGGPLLSSSGGGGQTPMGGPLPSSSGREQALHSKTGAPASGGDSNQSASAEGGGVGGASGDTAGGGASSPSSGGGGSESSSGASAPPASSATAGGGMGASGKAGGNTAAPSAPGDASTAGIGGASGGSGNLAKDIAAEMAKMQPNNKPSHAQRLGDAARQAGDMASQDNHSVSISMNTRGE